VTKPGQKQRRRVEKDRLAYYVSGSDKDFWDRHWQENFSPGIYERAERGILGRFFEHPFTRWLPREGRILDAGCGLGATVLALRARGYDVEGIEIAPSVVALAKQWRPEIPVRLGDVTRVDVPDGHYGGYISLGVVEHRKAGPEPFLAEAARLLRPGGVALISVPWFNQLRQWKGRLGMCRGDITGLGFYQYAFTEEAFCNLMRCFGFEVVAAACYDPTKCLKDEIVFLKRLLGNPHVGETTDRVLQRMLQCWPKVARRLGHMLLVTGRKR
jgi:SAM-dependent methyltransferase